MFPMAVSTSEELAVETLHQAGLVRGAWYMDRQKQGLLMAQPDIHYSLLTRSRLLVV